MSFYPGEHNLSIYQGDTVSLEIQYLEGPTGAEVGKSLDGSSTRCEVRTEPGSANVVASFTVTPDADQVTNPGLLVIELAPADSALLSLTSYAYDLEITWSDGVVQTLIYGSIAVRKDVSKA